MDRLPGDLAPFRFGLSDWFRFRLSWRTFTRSTTLVARTERLPNNSSPGQKRVRSVEELEAEIRRLRVENTKLLEQREVLEKSLGILSEVPPSGMPESRR